MMDHQDKKEGVIGEVNNNINEDKVEVEKKKRITRSSSKKLFDSLASSMLSHLEKNLVNESKCAKIVEEQDFRTRNIRDSQVNRSLF